MVSRFHSNLAFTGAPTDFLKVRQLYERHMQGFIEDPRCLRSALERAGTNGLNAKILYKVLDIICLTDTCFVEGDIRPPHDPTGLIPACFSMTDKEEIVMPYRSGNVLLKPSISAFKRS